MASYMVGGATNGMRYFLATLAFLPSIVAARRQNAGAIFVLNLVLNLFLGITVIGWAVALVWAYTEVRKLANPSSAA